MPPPTRPERKVPLDTSVRGSTGLPVYSGYVFDEVLPELQGERGRRIFREMSEQDPIIGGILLGIEMLSRQVPWTVKPADETAKAKDIADFVDECLSDMYPNFDNTLSEILSMLTFGWSWLEIVYKKRNGLKLEDTLRSSRFSDGKVGWAGWSIRSQETLHQWEFSEPDKGQVAAMVQWAPPTWSTSVIPRSKSLHFTTRSRRENPEGLSLLRNAYRSWYMKKNIEIIEGIGIERDLAGLPVMWAPPELFSSGKSAEEAALFEHLQKIVTSIKRDEQEGILLPLAYDEEGKNPLYKLELLATGGDRQFDTNSIVSRYNENMAMSMLADFILMGHQSVGSYALSSTKTGLFSTALGAILDLIAAEINQNGIPRLVRINGWPLAKSPTIEHGQIEAADMGKLGAFLKALYDAGMHVFPNPVLEKYVLSQAGLPTDPGAGELPVTIDPATGLPVPVVPGQPVPGQPPVQPGLVGPNGAPLPRHRRSEGQGASTAPMRPVGQPIPPAPSRTRLAASEGEPPARKSKHFVSLANRMARLAPTFEAELDPEDYRELAGAALAAGKFTKLEPRFQDMILAAESRSVEV